MDAVPQLVLDAGDTAPPSHLTLNLAETACRPLSDNEGEMTTDLDDLSPVESKPEPQPELHETDLDEMMLENETQGEHSDPFETAIDEDTATPSMGDNEFEEECTTSQSSSCQLGDMEKNDGVFPVFRVND